ncbi:MAG: IclR family transcriptional regulator [Thermodesulfobacteriota bacterium]|nr:IclR family transcriptional regulator [Thermodesulfobacteriota bacterium]
MKQPDNIMKQPDKTCLLNKINSIEKALMILTVFREGQPSWGVRELSTHLGFSPSTIQRILQILKTYGFIRQDPNTRLYSLGNIYLSFFRALQNNYPITRIAMPLMKRLLSRTGETIHLNIIDTDCISRICISSLESTQELKATMPVGNKAPLYAGATSKCLLAFSSQDFIDKYLAKVKLEPLTNNTIVEIEQLISELALIRERGYASSLGETLQGLGALSVPFFSFHQGMPVRATASLAIPEVRFNNYDHRKMCIEELLLAGREFSEATGCYDENLP